MKLVIDVENTVTNRDGKLHLDPFESTNTLVMVGILTDTGDEYQITFDHADKEPTENGHKIVQDLLDKASAIICLTLRMICVAMGITASSMMVRCSTLCLLVCATAWYQTAIIS